MACGRNSLCTGDGQCSCPGSSSYPVAAYFREVKDYEPNLGCYESNPLTCNATQDQDFVRLDNFNHLTPTTAMRAVTVETCKQKCLNNCSCKAVIYDNSYSDDKCYLLYELLTFSNVNSDYYRVSAFIKVQNVTSTSLSPPHRVQNVTSTSLSPSHRVQNVTSASLSPSHKVATIICSSVGSFLLLVFLACCMMLVVRKRRKFAEIEEEYLDKVPGMLTRFSDDELKSATDNFSKKLGQGGFGSVFEGTLGDGSKIAVKCLEGLGHIKKSFLAEVESIGSIHHVNLVRLRGFCAGKSQWLLVYEFMSNGSLDQWIYNGNMGHVLEWACRKKIISDIAKGLAYLHEDCRQKIIHLDIKPQNILLDSDFNAKLSDFGLSKLIDRNQTQVMTTIKGTPGYMAPEWWSSGITEKVDVYSFGIVLLEILSGRKIFDRSLLEEDWHLLSIFQKCCEQGTLLDMVDRCSEDMQANGSEVAGMMKLASWCLQTDPIRRPSMSSVVKVLEGGMNVELNLDHNFTDPRMKKKAVEPEKELTQFMPSILSGPR